MASKNQVLGQARIKADGELFDTDKQATLDLGGPERTAVEGDFSADGFQEATKPSRLECAIFVKPGTSAAQLRTITDATVTFEADTGQTYLIRGAYVADTINISQSDGKANVVFGGPPAEEI